VDVKIEKGTLIITLPLKVPQPLRVGLPQFVAGTAKVQRTKLQVAGNDVYIVANGFVCPGHTATPRMETAAAEVIDPKMRAARKALEKRKTIQRQKPRASQMKHSDLWEE
jgi:hypothetical protein